MFASVLAVVDMDKVTRAGKCGVLQSASTRRLMWGSMLLVDNIDHVDIGLARSRLGLLSRHWAYWIDIGPTASTLGLPRRRSGSRGRSHRLAKS